MATANTPRQQKASHGQAKEERKHNTLSHSRASITRSISDALVIKAGDIFFLSEADGDVPLEGGHGFGLYYNDCRYLNAYEMRLGKTKPDVLMSNVSQGFKAIFEFTNREADASLTALPLESIGIKLERTLDSSSLSLQDVYSIRNYSAQGQQLTLSLMFRSEFEDIFVIRGLFDSNIGKLQPHSWEDDVLRFLYDGADGYNRCLNVQFSPPPSSKQETSAQFDLKLGPGEQQQIYVSLAVVESQETGKLQPARDQKPVSHTAQVQQAEADIWVAENMHIKSNSVIFNRIIERAFRDLRVLKTSIRGQDFFAAGIPWFATLFGRDSLITALQTLPFNSMIATETLKLLASYQGTKVDAWRDEEPGKILHELRVGELARSGEIPHTPSYATVDATPLFLILVAEYVDWTGDLSLLNELGDSVEKALVWIDEYADVDGDGYADYRSTVDAGLVNQGWKDSGDAIVNVDGTLAIPPISLVEMQGYVYLAKVALSRLYRRTGENQRSDRLIKEAEALRSNFNRDFWLADKSIYALALQSEDKTPVSVVSSNPGHALWAGIADPDKAGRVVKRLMDGDMFSGWGIRTLSDKEEAYNPIGYHLGTVWPHDNSMIATGFRRYGFDDEAQRVFDALLDAVLEFPNNRMPEAFAGFGREGYGMPVRYPVACHPQAWAAGSILYMLIGSLGLRPDPFERKLYIVRPRLPRLVNDLQIDDFRVGSDSVDLRFQRTSNGSIEVIVAKNDGRVEIVTQNAS